MNNLFSNEDLKKKAAWGILLVAVIAMAYLTYISGESYQSGDEPAVKSSSLAQKKPEKKEPSKVKVLVEELALRSSPGVQYGNRIGSAKQGEVLELTGREGNWYKVKTAQGQTGYVSAKPQYTQKVN